MVNKKHTPSSNIKRHKINIWRSTGLHSSNHLSASDWKIFYSVFLVWFVKSDYVIVEMIPQLHEPIWFNDCHRKCLKRFYRNDYFTGVYRNACVSVCDNNDVLKKIEMSISVDDVNDMVAAAADDTYCGFHKLLIAEKEETPNTDINQMFASNRPFFSVVYRIK